MVSFDGPLKPGKSRPTGEKFDFTRKWPFATQLNTSLEVKSPATQWSKFRDLIHTVFGIGVEEKVEQECGNRCLIHPSNRYTCGKARSQDQCDAVGCCWDENSQHCYKEACKYTNNIQLFVKRVYTTSSSCTSCEVESRLSGLYNI